MLNMMQLVPGVELFAYIGKGHNHITITLTFHAVYALYDIAIHLQSS